MLDQFTCERCGSAFTPSDYGRRFCTRSCARRAPRPSRRVPLADRLWARVTKTETCWPCSGRPDKNGYRHIKLGDGSRKAVGAHVASWILEHGPISDGLWVLHHCDNPPCVRPDHLYLGTVIENARDRVQRGRGLTGDKHPRRLNPERWALEKQPRGESHGRSVLTEDQVREVRLMAENVDASHKTIAEMYGVSRPAISLILSGKTWSHLRS